LKKFKRENGIKQKRYKEEEEEEIMSHRNSYEDLSLKENGRSSGRRRRTGKTEEEWLTKTPPERFVAQ
jgi:hypothetical protein